jgi:plastocyanin
MTRVLGLLLVAFAVAIPAFAKAGPRAPGTIVAVDYAFQNPADGSSTVTIAAGETVSFGYPDGRNFHSVVFAGGQSPRCTPALPDFPSGPGWQSACTFDSPGTYAFVCGAHEFMTGTVVVTGDTTPTPTATATATQTAGPTATATATATPAASTTPTATATATATPIATAAATAPPATNPVPQTGGPIATLPAAAGLKVAATQRGQWIKGSLTIGQANSRLKVEILRGKSRLATSTRTVKQGNATFALKVKRQTRTVKLTVKVTVTPPAGAPFTASRTVTLKR